MKDIYEIEADVLDAITPDKAGAEPIAYKVVDMKDIQAAYADHAGKQRQEQGDSYDPNLDNNAWLKAKAYETARNQVEQAIRLKLEKNGISGSRLKEVTSELMSIITQSSLEYLPEISNQLRQVAAVRPEVNAFLRSKEMANHMDTYTATIAAIAGHEREMEVKYLPRLKRDVLDDLAKRRSEYPTEKSYQDLVNRISEMQTMSEADDDVSKALGKRGIENYMTPQEKARNEQLSISAQVQLAKIHQAVAQKVFVPKGITMNCADTTLDSNQVPELNQSRIIGPNTIEINIPWSMQFSTHSAVSSMIYDALLMKDINNSIFTLNVEDAICSPNVLDPKLMAALKSSGIKLAPESGTPTFGGAKPPQPNGPTPH